MLLYSIQHNGTTKCELRIHIYPTLRSCSFFSSSFPFFVVLLLKCCVYSTVFEKFNRNGIVGGYYCWCVCFFQFFFFSFCYDGGDYKISQNFSTRFPVKIAPLYYIELAFGGQDKIQLYWKQALRTINKIKHIYIIKLWKHEQENGKEAASHHKWNQFTNSDHVNT